MTWRRVENRTWTDEWFAELDVGGKLIWLYLLTGPQANRIGLYPLSVRRMSRDVGIHVDQVESRLMDMSAGVNPQLRWDEDREVVLIRKWLKYNVPDNPNQAIGWVGDLDVVPHDTPLLDEWISIAMCRTASGAKYRTTFAEKLKQRFGKRFPKRFRHEEKRREEKRREEDPNRELFSETGGSMALTPQLKTPQTQAPQASPGSTDPLRLDFQTGKWNRLPTAAEKKRWAKAYPLVKLPEEMAKATDFLLTDKRGPGYKNHASFLAGWFRRAQDNKERRGPR